MVRHGTKPKEDLTINRAGLDARIATLPHTLVASFPQRLRGHSAVRFTAEDSARFGTVMKGWIKGLGKSPERFAADFFDSRADNPVAVRFREAAEKVAAAGTNEEIQAASDAVAAGMQAVGLDWWRRFLADAGERVQANAGSSDPPPRPTATPAPPSTPPAQPEQSRFRRWLHEVFSIPSPHERAEMLRRSLGATSGQIFYRNDQPVDVDGMSDEEVIAFAREIADNRPSHLPPVVVGPTGRPEKTQFGWEGSESWNEARKQLDIPGTHETVNGRVPTVNEAKRMIERNGGTIDRVERGHRSGYESPHTEDHINYQTRGFKKGIVYVSEMKMKM